MYGDIVSNAEQGGMYDDVINAENVTDDLAALADDENVKAVVLRVNSGGRRQRIRLSRTDMAFPVKKKLSPARP